MKKLQCFDKLGIFFSLWSRQQWSVSLSDVLIVIYLIKCGLSFVGVYWWITVSHDMNTCFIRPIDGCGIMCNLLLISLILSGVPSEHFFCSVDLCISDGFPRTVNTPNAPLHTHTHTHTHTQTHTHRSIQFYLSAGASPLIDLRCDLLLRLKQ